MIADVPPAVVTLTSTAPALLAGAIAVICVAESNVKEAGVLPKLTAVTPVKLVPVITTVVPPAVVPDDGETAVTVGGAITGTVTVIGLDVPPGLVAVKVNVSLPEKPTAGV